MHAPPGRDQFEVLPESEAGVANEPMFAPRHLCTCDGRTSVTRHRVDFTVVSSNRPLCPAHPFSPHQFTNSPIYELTNSPIRNSPIRPMGSGLSLALHMGMTHEQPTPNEGLQKAPDD